MIFNNFFLNLFLTFFLNVFRFFKKPNNNKNFLITTKKRQKKKNLFFKKHHNTKNLFSKRLSVVFKRNTGNFFFKKFFKRNTGNFFFKKFFFKTLIFSRKLLSKHFFKTTKNTRQKKLTKVLKKYTNTSRSSNISFENRLVYILLKSHVFLFLKDASIFISSGFVYINGAKQTNHQHLLKSGDCIQIKLGSVFYIFLLFFKNFIKNKVLLYKQNSWLFFKQTQLNKLNNKIKKRKTPNYLYFLFLYKYNTDRYLEVDYTTLTIFLLKKYNFQQNYTYFIKKTFSFKLFALYNFKKIN